MQRDSYHVCTFIDFMGHPHWNVGLEMIRLKKIPTEYLRPPEKKCGRKEKKFVFALFAVI